MDYNETICQSIEIITKGLIERISYDKTIEGIVIAPSTILDNNNQYYQIAYGKAYLLAIGKINEYTKGDCVYILIPQGNFDLQKIILMKKYNE